MLSSDEYYSYVESGAALCHEGVKGMAWGVRNGPPYPLNSEGKARASKARHILGSTKTREARLNDKANKNETMARLNKKLVDSKIRDSETKSSSEKAKAQAKIKSIENKQSIDRARHKGTSNRLQDKLEKQRYKTEMARLKKEQKLAQRATKEEKPKENKPSAKEQAKAAMKERIINSGDPKTLKKYGKLLNADEYRAAVNRIQMVNDLKSAKIQNFVNRGKQVSEAIRNFADASTKGIETVNNGIKILNIIRGRKGEKPITLIGESPKAKEAKDYVKALEQLKSKTIHDAIKADPDKYLDALIKQYIKFKGDNSNNSGS